MFRPIVSSKAPILLVGGGEATPEDLLELLTGEPKVVAADGGARLALQAGVVPDAVIGDFDSLDMATRAALPPDRLFHVPDQDSTDFEKCLARIEAPLILGLGFLGRRIDHQLATFTALLKTRARVVLVTKEEVCWIAPPKMVLDLAVDTPIGLYPLLPARLSTRGVRYPLTDAAVAPDGLISTSNMVTAPWVEIEVDRHALLVIAPRAAQGAVMRALLRAEPHARAG